MAILKRRTKRKPHQQVKEYVWPTQGWRRTARYYKHRLFRGGDSTYRIAGGLAMGGAISFTPFIGTHFIQAFLFAWLFRMNGFASLLGTALGNPWTFPFLFWSSYATGAFMVRMAGFGDFIALPDDMGFATLVQHPKDFLDFLFSNPVKILLPFGLGGYVAGAVFWFIAYGLLYYPVRLFKRFYHKQRLLRIYKRQVAAKKKRDVQKGSPS